MDRQDMLAGFAEATKAGSGTASATATQPAPGPGKQLIVTGFSISFGVSSTAAGTYQIRRGGTITVRQGNLPIGAMAPIIYEFKRPLVCGDNESVDLFVTGATTATIIIELYTVTRPTSSNQVTPAFT